MSARSAALAQLRSRLVGILKANGYKTDAGDLVLIGETPTLGPDDPSAALYIDVKQDEVRYQGENITLVLPVEVLAIVKADLDDPWMTIEDIIEDVKRAVETDHNLGGTVSPRGLDRGSTRPLDREDGSEFIGAGVEYRLSMAEGWGSP